jgi:hypothetical protein
MLPRPLFIPPLALIVTALGAACAPDRTAPAEIDGLAFPLSRHECRVKPEALRNAKRTMGRLTAEGEDCAHEDPCPSCDGLFVGGWDASECFWSPFRWDPDGDFVDNGCENALAMAFAPELIAARDCNYDRGLKRQGGEYYFAAGRVTTGSGESLLRIAYLPAYYVDCGTPRDQLSGCLDFLGFGFCDGHTGDSELIIVDTRFDLASSHWITARVFLSAHCGEVTGSNCDWQSVSAFEWVDDRRLGAPVVWVAEGKHAHYVSSDACDDGANRFDECDFNNARFRFPIVYGQQNIGSRSQPLRDCVGPFWGSDMTNPASTECLWSTSVRLTFDGWQGYSHNGGARPYGDQLALYAGF